MAIGWNKRSRDNTGELICVPLRDPIAHREKSRELGNLFFLAQSNRSPLSLSAASIHGSTCMLPSIRRSIDSLGQLQVIIINDLRRDRVSGSFV